MSPAVTHAVVKPLYDMLMKKHNADQANADQANADKVNVRLSVNDDAQSGNNNTRFSIVDVDGTNVAYIENPITNKQASSFECVASILSGKYGSAYDVLETGDKVYIGKDIQTEYVRSEYSTSILKNRNLLRAKFKASSGIEDVIAVANNKHPEKLQNKENTSIEVSGVYKYKTVFAFPIKQSDNSIIDIKAYSATMVVLESTDGELYLYDLVTIKEKKGIANRLKETAKANNASETQGLSYDERVPQTSNRVNTESNKMSTNIDENIQSNDKDVSLRHSINYDSLTEYQMSELDPNADYALNININTQDFVSQILSGEKTIETRASRIPGVNIGDRVGIVATGNKGRRNQYGKSLLRGYATVTDIVDYKNAEQFRADEDKHLVKEGSAFDIQDGKAKVGYVLSDVVELDDPIPTDPDRPGPASGRNVRFNIDPDEVSPEVRQHQEFVKASADQE